MKKKVLCLMMSPLIFSGFMSRRFSHSARLSGGAAVRWCGCPVVLMIFDDEIGRRRVGKECLRLCRSRWSPYRPSPDHVSSYPGPCRRPHVSAVVTDGRTARPSFAMPRPNSACNRRRHRRFTNVYSCVMPWRFMMARSAARLRRGVGRHLNPKGPCRTAQAAIKRVPVIHSSK